MESKMWKDAEDTKKKRLEDVALTACDVIGAGIMAITVGVLLGKYKILKHDQPDIRYRFKRGTIMTDRLPAKLSTLNMDGEAFTWINPKARTLGTGVAVPLEKLGEVGQGFAELLIGDPEDIKHAAVTVHLMTKVGKGFNK